MKHAKILAFALAALFATAIQAEGSYVGFGLGIQFNLASLGNTIVNDGLQGTAAGPPPNVRANNGAGGANCMLTQTCPADAFATDNQKVIVDEKTLVALSRLTLGNMDAKVSGPMIGGEIKAFYEKEFASGAWVRGGAGLMRKIAGGSTISHAAGIEWYNVQWNYSRLNIPIMGGFKAGIGETVSVYAGGGLSYNKGFFQLTGTNLGNVPTTFLARYGTSVGLVTTVGAGNQFNINPVTGAVTTPTSTSASLQGIWGSKAKFKAEGLGFNFVTGIEKKLETGDKLFFEIGQVVAGGIGRRGFKDPGAISAFAPVAAYPVDLSGTTYSFGYKMHM